MRPRNVGARWHARELPLSPNPLREALELDAELMSRVLERLRLVTVYLAPPEDFQPHKWPDPEEYAAQTAALYRELLAAMESAQAALAASPPLRRHADDDEITRRLHDLAEGSWDDPRALLARVELYAEQGRMPSGGLRADIEAYLGMTRDWRCEDCTALNRSHETFCFTCGACAPDEHRALSPPASPPSDADAAYRRLADQAADLLSKAGAPGAAAIFGRAAAEGLGAASSPPARTDWRIAWRDAEGEVRVTHELTGPRSEATVSGLVAALNARCEPGRAPYFAQRREVGPWQDVPSEGAS